MNTHPETAPGDGATITTWIREHAHPLEADDPAAPLTDLEALRDLVGEATVVALGASTRGAQELITLQHRMVRFLVERLGFRSLALEGDAATASLLDAYVRTGDGDPATLLAEARAFWRTADLLDVVAWMRTFNAAGPDDPVRLFSPSPTEAQLTSADGQSDLERLQAEATLDWRERTGHRIVYWGGIAHTAVAAARTASAPPIEPDTGQSTGGHLRQRLGAGYVSLGLTFGQGRAPDPVPAPPADFAEAVLVEVGPDSFLLPLRAADLAWPEPVRRWLTRPTRTRLIGPVYDPEDDAAYHLAGGAFADWFDAVVHTQHVTPLRPLP